MGCDWYTIKSITGVGYFIEGSLTDKYQRLLNQNGKYECFRFAIPLHHDKVSIWHWIYDIDTLQKTKISIPGQYEIYLTSSIL